MNAKMEPVESLPIRVEDLIDLLDEKFPEQCPTLGTPMEKVWFDAGARSVVRYLRSLQEELKQGELD